MDFLDWITQYQSGFQSRDARVYPTDPVDYQYEKIIADKQRKDNANCSRCNHMGVWHSDTGKCELCNTRCVFQFRAEPRPDTPNAERSKPYAYGRTSKPAEPSVERPSFHEFQSSGSFPPNAPSRDITEIYVHEGMSEKEFQDQVIRFAELHNWKTMHTSSRGSGKGWPDLVLVRPPEMVCLELKAQNGRLSPEQIVWLRNLDKCEGIVARMVKPSDWEEIKRLLRVDSQLTHEVAQTDFFESRRQWSSRRF